jgi:exodeoxyribonuclease V beta subunit
VRRLRALIDRLLAHGATAPGGTRGDVWTLDAAARARLTDAQRTFDRATITTIHGFCQRVLTEDAFASRRLLAQQHVDSKRAFSEAFRETLRTTLATDPALAGYLRAWLVSGRSTNGLERVLGQALTQQRPWGVTYDEARLRRALAAFAALPIDETLNAQLKRMTMERPANALAPRIQTVFQLCERFVAHGDPAMALAELDAAIRR